MVGTRRSVMVVAVAGALAAPGAAAAATTLHASLSGKREVPRADGGRGSARITLNKRTGRVCYRIRTHHVGTMMMGHIHKGGKSTAGPIVVPLFTSPTRHPRGCVKAPKSLVRRIARHPGRYYVNVHTAKFPAGAARGQLHR
jgi:hypothetical protein